MKYRALLLAAVIGLPVPLHAQYATTPLGAGPWVFGNFEEQDVRVSVLARSLDRPIDLVFLPTGSNAQQLLGDVLISEAGAASVRHIRNGVLLPQPVLVLRDHYDAAVDLQSLALHPDFSDNALVYFTWTRSAPHPDGSDRRWATTALSRARWDGARLVDVELIFEAEAWSSMAQAAHAPLQFLPDGTLLLGVSQREDVEPPQLLNTHIGKVLRLNDDGSVPSDNPYVAVEGALSEIYASGMRSVMDFALHPASAAVWELQGGPPGSDEVTVLQPRLNYGWPLDRLATDAGEQLVHRVPWVEGSVRAEVAWAPPVMASSLLFYTGSAFPDWQNNLFVSALQLGRVPGTGHLQRVAFNELGEMRREMLLTELKQPLRLVVQGPDELLYLLTDGSDAALLRLEPVPAEAVSGGDASDLNNLAAFAASDCGACHRTDAVLVGPSYVAIAERYEPSADNVALLMQRIRLGGAGAWGEVPMNPHTDLAPETLRDMVERILSLRN